ncbi:Gfo/Idh/MocA family oxidoreductase [Anaerocolumna sedimenticola]|uniref:Gfo/Idh/MocA family oxidoreductase n=1 Tax=Anaerocolumna sedimenticola TaxID=2696063 RepID=A0A6P1TMT6_9FIRM|nr:Gfo/Idh/MocA family oxidoreductase [Anaerocolumna sedimenticola]QHQ62314.1 Gfo/Idh/MocA family oxidoreductase [Anaerocolumna sedimenticola]
MIRFATIGTSKITRQLLGAAAQLDNFKLLGAYSRELEKAESFGREFGAELFFHNLDDLADCSMIDAVYIASPNSLHYDQTVKMLRSGKHVLCEKSMGANVKEVKSMLQVAKDNNVKLLEAMRPIFDPGQKLIKENLSKIGTVRRVTLDFCQYSSRYDAFKKGETANIFDPKLSAGALMDIGVYCVHSLIDLFGHPDSVNSASVILSNGIDGAGSILAKYEDMISELIYSKITNSQVPSQIQGENGVILIPHISSPRNFKIKYNDNSEEEIVAEACENNMIYELNTFMEAIEKNEKLDYYNEVSLNAIKVMDQVRKQLGIIFPSDNRTDI